MVTKELCVECICGTWFPTHSRCDYCHRTLQDVTTEELKKELEKKK